MDPHFTKAVVKVFVDLHGQGLIYRDKRLVNWDPRLKTAISDLEVETREIDGKFWHFRYPLSDGSGHISVATTRPETMLADMLVAVNPADERYQDLVARGVTVTLPITGREIPIVFDEHADPELGSGAVKITPGHDFNDFEVGKRAGIKAGDMLNMLDAEAKVCQTADGLVPAEFVGTDRFEARKRVVELMDEDGLLEKVEDRVIQTPLRRPWRRGDRAVADRPVVCRCRDLGKGADGRGALGRDRNRAEDMGKRHSSTGWRTSSRGASAASCGGGIGFRRGMGRA